MQIMNGHVRNPSQFAQFLFGSKEVICSPENAQRLCSNVSFNDSAGVTNVGKGHVSRAST